jgi:hypothetical protein
LAVSGQQHFYMKQSNSNPLWVCYCDYDGCLHDDAVYWHPKRGIYLGTPSRTLFEWMPILENLLAPHPQVKIVLSTSWIRMRGFQFAKSKLSPVLQERVIGATFHNREMRKDEFDLMSRGQQVLADVERRCPTNWFAIDNDGAGWPEHLREHLVLTQDCLGLSEPRVQEQIRKLLGSCPKKSNFSNS